MDNCFHSIRFVTLFGLLITDIVYPKSDRIDNRNQDQRRPLSTLVFYCIVILKILPWCFSCILIRMTVLIPVSAFDPDRSITIVVCCVLPILRAVASNHPHVQTCCLCLSPFTFSPCERGRWVRVRVTSYAPSFWWCPSVRVRPHSSGVPKLGFSSMLRGSVSLLSRGCVSLFLGVGFPCCLG